MLCNTHSAYSSRSFLICYKVHLVVKGLEKGRDVLLGLIYSLTILFLFMLLIHCLEKKDWFICWKQDSVPLNNMSTLKVV